MELPFGSETPKLDVLIVGAGLSGLTSGVKLLEKEQSLQLKIIDENLPGGLIRGVDKRSVNLEQSEMISFMQQLNVSLIHRDIRKDGSLIRCWDLDRGLLSYLIKFELERYINMIELRMKKFSPQRVQYRDRAPSMKRHICYHLFFGQSRHFMFNVVELITGLPPCDITYDEFMAVCSSCGGLCVLINMYIHQSTSVMEVSCERLLEALLEKLKSVEISSNEKVLQINHFKDYVEVITTEEEPYIAQAVILAIPWDRVSQLTFNPPIPEQYAHTNNPAKGQKRLLTQYHMTYSKSYWVNRGFSGEFMNIRPMMIGNGLRPAEYGGFILHNEEESSVKSIVTSLLSDTFGKDMMQPLDYKQTTFEMNSVRGRLQTKPWLRVIWSSSSVAANNNRNLMGGAVESGLRAAVNALYVVRPQVVSWRDLKGIGEKQPTTYAEPSTVTALLSRLNLYNLTFYSVFVIGLIMALNYGYNPPE